MEMGIEEITNSGLEDVSLHRELEGSGHVLSEQKPTNCMMGRVSVNLS